MSRRRGGVSGPWRRYALLGSLLPSLVVLILYAVAGETAPLAALEGQTLSWRLLARGPIEPGPEVVVVAVDDRSIAALGRWPIPRERLAETVETIAADGARVIAIDLLVTEPQGGLPPAAVDALREAQDRLGDTAPALASRIGALLALEAPDDRLAAAMAAAGNVVLGYAFVFDATESNVEDMPPDVGRSAYRITTARPGGHADIGMWPAGVLAPPPTLAGRAASTGHVTVKLDPDNVLRHEYPVIEYNGSYYPSLPIEAVRLYDGLAPDRMAVRFGEVVAVGQRLVPTDWRTRVVINASGPPGTFETHSLIDVLDGRLPEGTFADRIVLLGSTVTGGGDTFSTAFSPMLPGVEHWSTVIDNILQGRTLIRGGWTLIADVLAILVCGALATILGRVGPLPVSGALVAGLLVAWGFTTWFALSEANLWLNASLPAAAIVLSFLWVAGLRTFGERRRRRTAERQRANLARYFPPRLVARLAESDRPFAIDRTQYAAILFIDIVQSTRLVQGLPPAEAMALLRAFHRRVEQAVFAHDGTLNQFLGDGAFACFGVPDPGPHDALNALRCARALAADIAAWNRARLSAGEPEVRIGIGLHYGPVLMGDIGGTRQFQFTVTGDTVNVASRLEALTRDHDATLVASDALVEAAQAVAGPEAAEGFTPLPVQQLRGRERSVGVWAWRLADDATPAATLGP